MILVYVAGPFSAKTRDRGGVYAIADDRGYIKIGRAQNIRKRVAQLQGMNAGSLRLVAVLSWDQTLEPRIHRKLKAAGHVRGEWFCPTPRVLEELRSGRAWF